jgi:hypothetical protein
MRESDIPESRTPSLAGICKVGPARRIEIPIKERVYFRSVVLVLSHLIQVFVFLPRD